MKTVAILSAALVAAGLASAGQSLQVPKCAAPCVEKYTTGGGIAGCGQLDVACICKNKDFLSGIQCCLTDKCDATELKTTISFAKGICSSAGVTVPDSVSCDSKSSSSGGSKTAAAASAAKSSAAATKTSGSKKDKASATTSAAAASKTSKAAAAATGLHAVGGVVAAAAGVLFAL